MGVDRAARKASCHQAAAGRAGCPAAGCTQDGSPPQASCTQAGSTAPAQQEALSPVQQVALMLLAALVQAAPPAQQVALLQQVGSTRTRSASWWPTRLSMAPPSAPAAMQALLQHARSFPCAASLVALRSRHLEQQEALGQHRQTTLPNRMHSLLHGHGQPSPASALDLQPVRQPSTSPRTPQPTSRRPARPLLPPCPAPASCSLPAAHQQHLAAHIGQPPCAAQAKQRVRPPQCLC